MGRRLISDDKIMDKIDMILTNVTSDTEIQKKIYVVGTLLGSAIAQGTGFKGAGGKFKLQDIVGMGIQGFIQKMMGGAMGQQQEGTEMQVIPPENKRKGW
jgi:hypothetical protein